MSAHPNPGIDLDPISTGFISLSHPLEIIDMLGIGLPANSTHLQVLDVYEVIKVNATYK